MTNSFHSASHGVSKPSKTDRFPWVLAVLQDKRIGLVAEAKRNVRHRHEKMRSYTVYIELYIYIFIYLHICIYVYQTINKYLYIYM